MVTGPVRSPEQLTGSPSQPVCQAYDATRPLRSSASAHGACLCIFASDIGERWRLWRPG